MNKHILNIWKGLGNPCFQFYQQKTLPQKLPVPVTACMLPQVRLKLMTFGIGVEHASQRAKGQA